MSDGRRLTFGSLFAGIGGFDLGFERAGLHCGWQVEIDPYCRQVLENHWPTVARHDDVRTFPPDDSDRWRVDLICGGFPCQDISDAGRRAGIDGERSGLWREYSRIICELRPRYVVVENVSALLDRGLERVLGDLAANGFDAEWACLPACSFGAPHIRDRVFILAYANGRRAQELPTRRRTKGQGETVTAGGGPATSLRDTRHAERRGLEGRVFRRSNAPPKIAPSGRSTSLGTYLGEAWATEPEQDWLDDGLSGQLAEFCSRSIGNSVSPVVAEWIGRRLMEVV